jgi:NADH-quinone oxidoreductase subunit L
VFMVFFGECRADPETRHHLHESPPVMTVPLWILMGGSALAGLLWIPHVFLPFEHWLEPVMGHPAAHAETAGAGTELAFMCLSVLVAAAGIGLAYLIYVRRSLRPETFSAALGGMPYRAVLNKFWVDELYQLVFVRGTLLLCALVAWFDLHVIDGLIHLSAATTRALSWLSGRFDLYVVDGAVNLIADGTQFVGRRVRNVQTGAISAYLYVVLLGVLGGVLLYWSWAAAW